MADPTNTKSNGAKAFGGVMAVVAIGSICAMLWQMQAGSVATLERLMDQRITLISSQIERATRHAEVEAHPVAREWNRRIQEQISMVGAKMHEDDEREITDAGEYERMNEQLREIETQFRHMDRLIQLLWNRVYQEPLPNPPERAN